MSDTNTPQLPNSIRVEIDVYADFVADWLTSDIEHYDENHEPEDGWSIESSTIANPLETLKTLIEDLLSDARCGYDDPDLRGRVAASVASIATEEATQ